MLRVGSILGLFFFPVVLTAFGFTATFALLAVMPFAVGLVTLAIRWEPIGVDIEAGFIDLTALATVDLREPAVALAGTAAAGAE